MNINALLALIGITLLLILAAAAIFTPQAKAFELPCYLQPGDACRGADGADGAPGLDGKDGANGRDANPAGLAVMAALNNPIWLEANESIALSFGWGTHDAHHALGGTVVLRLDEAWSINGGAATDTKRDAWAARAGVRVGW
jgi:hypothetical protein